MSEWKTFFFDCKYPDRIRDLIHDKGISSPDQFMKFTKTDLLYFQTIGHATVKEIERCLEKCGYSLKPESNISRLKKLRKIR